MEKQLTSWEMECRLRDMGFAQNYLDSLRDSAIEYLYKTEYLG